MKRFKLLATCFAVSLLAACSFTVTTDVDKGDGDKEPPAAEDPASAPADEEPAADEEPGAEDPGDQQSLFRSPGDTAGNPEDLCLRCEPIPALPPLLVS